MSINLDIVYLVHLNPLPFNEQNSKEKIIFLANTPNDYALVSIIEHNQHRIDPSTMFHEHPNKHEYDGERNRCEVNRRYFS